MQEIFVTGEIEYEVVNSTRYDRFEVHLTTHDANHYHNVKTQRAFRGKLTECEAFIRLHQDGLIKIQALGD